MDCSIKIGAVFSLADDDSKSLSRKRKRSDSFEVKVKTEPVEIEDVDILSTREDDAFESVSEKPSTSSSHLVTSACYAAERTILSHHNSFTNSHPYIDQDSPPQLQIESYNASLPITELDSARQRIQPPVLEPIEPLTSLYGSDADQCAQPQKRRVTKIHPCYIVLTNVNPFIDMFSCSTSYRSFKRIFIECSNICKKTFFKRRLEAGKNVFNVKTPSKQKDYLLYLEKAECARKKLASEHKNTLLQFPMLKELLKSHDLRNKALGRIRRTISHVPKDFKESKISGRPLRQTEGEMLNKEQEEKRFESMRIQTFHRELNSLRKLVMIKRSSNKTLKRLRKTHTDAAVTFLKCDMKSTVSGRVRKINRKYIEDFALSKQDIDERIMRTHLQKRLKRTKIENKKRFEKETKESDNVVEEAKKEVQHKNIDIVIDNAEICMETKLTHTRQKSGKHKIDRKGNKMDVKVQALNGSDRLIDKKGSQTDEVIIQDFPNNEQLITDVLQNISCDNTMVDSSMVYSPIHDKKCSIKTHTKVVDGRRYVYIKSPLNKKVDSNRISLQGNTSETANNQNLNQTLDIKSSVLASFTMNKELLKKTQVPEKLLTVKTEPKSEHHTSSAANPKFIRVVYSGNADTKMINESPETLTPFIVTTKGMRSIVMKSTVPSYSKAMKMKFNSSTTNIKSIASTKPSGVILKSSQDNIPKLQTTHQQQIRYTLVPEDASSKTATSLFASDARHPVPKAIAKVFSGDRLTQGIVRVTPPSAEVKNNGTTLLRPITCFSTNVVSLSSTVGQPTTVLSSTQKAGCQTSSAVKQLILPCQTSTSTPKPPVISLPNINRVQNISHPSAQTTSVIAQQVLKQEQVQQSASNTKNQSGNSNVTKTIEKCKFILVKVDGKNILIRYDQLQTKANFLNTHPGQIKASTPNENPISHGRKTIATAISGINLTVHEANFVKNPSINSMQTQPSTASVPRIKIYSQPSGKCTPVRTTQTVNNSNAYVCVPLPSSSSSSEVSIPNQTSLKSALKLKSLNSSTPQSSALPAVTNSLPKTVANVTVSKNSSNIPIVISKSVNIQDVKVKDSETVKTYDHDETEVTFKDVGIMKTKDDINPIEKSKANSTKLESQEKMAMKPNAFAEALTVREERLRMLKELLKEKERAVEELRQNKKKDSSERNIN